MNKYTRLWLAAGLAALAGAVNAQAQAIAPITEKDTLLAEVSRNVSLGFSMARSTWEKYSPMEVKVSKTAEGYWLLTTDSTGRNARITIDPKSFMHRDDSAGAVLSQIVELTTTHANVALEPGTTWKSEQRTIVAPRAYCSHNNLRLTSDYEVQASQNYTLKINGTETVIQVLPVVANGWWNDCYSGRRYTRYLVSKELGTVVSIEHIGLEPGGWPHESSYRLDIKEIKRL